MIEKNNWNMQLYKSMSAQAIHHDPTTPADQRQM